MKNAVLVFLIPILFLVSVTEAEGREVTKDFHKSFDVKKGFRLNLIHGDGDVTIKPWDQDVLDVTVYYCVDYKSIGLGGDHGFDVEFKQSNGVIHVIGKERISKAIGIQFFRRYEYTYTIRAPGYLELDLRGDDGDVHIEDWRGEVECRLDDGDIDLFNIDSPKTRIAFEDGDLHIEGHRGKLSLVGEDGDVVINRCNNLSCKIRLEDGDTRIKHSGGNFEIEVEDGDVKIYRLDAQRLDISTEDGDIDVDLLKADEPDIDITTGDGDVTLSVAPGTSASFTIDVDDGRIEVDLPPAKKLKKNHHWMSGEIYGGKGRIRIRTGDGSVTLRESK